VAARIEEQRRVEATIVDELRRQADNASVRELYESWVADGLAREDGNAEIRRSFEKDVLSQLGTIAVELVTEHELRALLRAVVARGANRMATALSRDLRQMFAWAEKRQPRRRLLQEGNPAALVEIGKIVSPDYDSSNIRSRVRVLSLEEIRELRDIFDRMEAQYCAATDRRSAIRQLLAETRLAL
jgi:hypothetical protein